MGHQRPTVAAEGKSVQGRVRSWAPSHLDVGGGPEDRRTELAQPTQCGVHGREHGLEPVDLGLAVAAIPEVDDDHTDGLRVDRPVEVPRAVPERQGDRLRVIARGARRTLGPVERRKRVDALLDPGSQ